MFRLHQDGEEMLQKNPGNDEGAEHVLSLTHTTFCSR